MRRILTVVITTAIALLMSVGMALAHPLSPPGNANGAPDALPIGPHPGHNGVQCAAEAGAPAFPVSLEGVFTCPAQD